MVAGDFSFCACLSVLSKILRTIGRKERSSLKENETDEVRFLVPVAVLPGSASPSASGRSRLLAANQLVRQCPPRAGSHPERLLGCPVFGSSQPKGYQVFYSGLSPALLASFQPHRCPLDLKPSRRWGPGKRRLCN